MPVVAQITMGQNDALSKDFLNNYIFTPISQLATPAAAYYSKPSSDPNITTVSTTFGYVDNTLGKFSLQIATTGAPIEMGFRGIASHSVATASVAFDIEVDGVNYTNGGVLAQGTHPTASGAFTISFREIIPVIAGGIHTFKLVWKVVSAGTGTLVSTHVPSFYVREL